MSINKCYLNKGPKFVDKVVDKVYTYMLFLLSRNYFQYYVQCDIKCNLLSVIMIAGIMEDFYILHLC